MHGVRWHPCGTPLILPERGRGLCRPDIAPLQEAPAQDVAGNNKQPLSEA